MVILPRSSAGESVELTLIKVDMGKFNSLVERGREF